MTLEEIQRYLITGSGGVCVDRSIANPFPSRVREVTILRGNRVMIELNLFDQDEGGPRYLGQFDSLEDLVNCLEAYFERPVAAWQNFSRSGAYPPEPKDWTGTCSSPEHDRFLEAVLTNTLHLPACPLEQQVPFWSREHQ